jgi:hypothetical protein
MPYGINIRNTRKAESAALLKAGYHHPPPKLNSAAEMQNWLIARDKVRDAARDAVHHWNSARMMAWLSKRVLPLDRENAKTVYQHLGLEQHKNDIDRTQIAERFRAVSITDNYWLKKPDDTLTWRDIDPRRIPLSEGFALVALTGGNVAALSSIADLTDKQAAAEVGMCGTYPKGCFRRKEKLYVVKGGSRHDVIAEWLSSRILSCLNVYGFCDYQLDEGNGHSGFPATGILSVYCEVMSNTERDLVMASSMFGTAEEMALKRFITQYAQIAVIDYIIGNPDRHLGNWGFYREAPDWKFTGLHDIYDNNRAFGMNFYSEINSGLNYSIVGRGTDNQKTLEEGAQLYKDIADLQFVRAVDKEWFKMLAPDWERYLNEFIRRCHKMGLQPFF